MWLQKFEQFTRKNGIRLPVKNFRRFYTKEPKRKRGSIANASIKVIGSGSPGEPASFALHTAGQSHLFNCGEGTDRIARCNRILRWTNVDNVFITRSDWSRIGGMLALMNEMMKRGGTFNYTIHGPETLEPIVERMHSIITGVSDSCFNFNCTESYVTRGLQIDLLPLTSGSDTMAYICKLDAHNGRLNLEKCVDLDIPLALIHKLKNFNKNETIPLPDGRLITWKDIHDYVDDEKNFIVVDVPSPECLHSLEQSEAFSALLNSNKRVDAIVHFSPAKNFETADYQQFLKRTNAQRHIVLNESNTYSGLVGVHRQQAQFNQLNYEIFPLLHSKVDPNPTTYDVKDDGNGTVHNVCTSTIFNLRKRGKSDDEINNDFAEDDVETSIFVDGGEETADRANLYPKIVFLGTSSQRSGPFRNVSSILVHTSENSSILLDCGEDTSGQIVRFYGSKAAEVFAKIKAIFISHLHGDHHYGLFEMLLQRNRLGPSCGPPILLMIPCKEFADWITFCSQHIGNVSKEIQFIYNNELLNADLADDMLAHLNVSSFRTCAVDHIVSSFGISTTISGCTGNAPFKLTYSGDTVPCESLVELGQNSTLLIHEATFENILLERAQKTKHCTVSQAIEQSTKMNAKYTILTHFSQRYTILPWIDGILGANVGIAFDNMELVEADLCKLSALHPRMKVVFANHLKLIEKMAVRNNTRQAFKHQL